LLSIKVIFWSVLEFAVKSARENLPGNMPVISCPEKLLGSASPATISLSLSLSLSYGCGSRSGARAIRISRDEEETMNLRQAVAGLDLDFEQ